jgi:hypothetical protein
VTPEERFAALVDEFAGRPGVAPPDEPGARGFGSGALKVDRSIFAMLSRGRLVVKLPATRVRALISDGTGSPFDAGKGRPMKEWLTVDSDELATWTALAGEGYDFVGSASRR